MTTLGETAPIRTNHPFKCAKHLHLTRQELALKGVQLRNRDAQRRENYVCVNVTAHFSGKKKAGGIFTCGRDLFRISMIDLHVWSSIAGYGSRRRCWLGDQKYGQFRMVVRAHIEFRFSLSSHRFPPFHEIFSNTWLKLILFHHDELVGSFGRWL